MKRFGNHLRSQREMGAGSGGAGPKLGQNVVIHSVDFFWLNVIQICKGDLSCFLSQSGLP